MLTIGTHMSIAGGIAKTAENVVKMEANTMQIFSRNPRGSNYKTYTSEEIEKFQSIRMEHHFGPILAHAPYTMNLASATEKTYEFASMVIREDIQRMDELGIENAGIQNIIRGLDQAVTADQNIHVLLETMSGKGTEIGVTFEELKAIRDGVKHPEKIGICLDTCHVFAAGYDIVNNLDDVLNEFDNIIGLNKLKAIHLNDSKNELGARKDRHEKIGEGFLQLETFKKIINHPKLKNIPFLLETPNDLKGYANEISLLQSLYED